MKSAPAAPSTVPGSLEENLALARLLEETAELLERQEANVFRVRAYRQAAAAIRILKRPVRDLHHRGGRGALLELPRIGESLSKAIETWLVTGVLGILYRLRGEETAGSVLCTVPGIGKELAARIHGRLGIETLEELELAAHDGRLSKVPGIGRRRLQSIRDQLQAQFQRRGRRRGGSEPAGEGAAPPAVAEVLDVDREYRERAEADRLPRIAPRRFNPKQEAWLPVLHTRRGVRHYTALYSNTARAHELGRTRDWVVVYLDDGASERQWTVVTEQRGALAGRRVVRGREEECRGHYSRAASQA